MGYISENISNVQIIERIFMAKDKKNLKRLLIMVQHNVLKYNSEEWKYIANLAMEKYIGMIGTNTYLSINAINEDINDICFESIYLPHFSKLLTSIVVEERILNHLINKFFSLMLINITLLARKESKEIEYWKKYLRNVLGNIDIKYKYADRVDKLMEDWGIHRKNNGMLLHEAENWNKIILCLESIIEDDKIENLEKKYYAMREYSDDEDF